MPSKWVVFRDKAEQIVAYGARLFFPILATVAPAFGLPTWVGVLAGSLVPQIMGLVESNTPAPGAGVMKKQQVLNIMNGIAGVLQKELPNMANVDITKMMPTISLLIDQTVTAANQLMPNVVADDVPAAPTPPPVVSASNTPGA